MKKYFYSLFAAATMLLATTSCSQEEDFVQQSSSDVTTFKVDLQGAVGSRAAGDGLTVDKLYYEVYQGDKKVLDNFGTGQNAEEVVFSNEGKASVKMPLMKGENYNIIFWAQKAEGSIYDADSLTNIKVIYNTDTKANKEAYDAFFNALVNFKATDQVTNVQLRRPFAQLNIGTIDSDWANAKKVISGTDAPVTTSEVTVTGLATNFNALTGSAEGETDVTFYQNALLTATTVDANSTSTTDVETFKVTTKDASNQVVTKTYYNLAMNYLLVPGKKDPQGEGLDTHKPATETEVIKTNANVTAKFWRGNKDLFELNIPNVTIQRNYRTNIYGTLLAADKVFEIEIAPIFDGDHNFEQSTVNNDLDLEKALKEDKEHIVIDLAVGGRAVGRTYNVNIGANQEEYYLGSERTKTITINANGNTINFIHNNTDWNYIRCFNDDAKWTINDAHLTNSSGAETTNRTGNDGPWNRHNIRFYNAVELNNVTSDKAIALLNEAKLEGVKISDEHPKNSQAYGLWVASYGQTVELNNCEIVAHSSKTKDLGITINDQYTYEGLAKSKLIVKNTKFVTKEGPAIMVESTAGADIILENIDISGTKDGFNAVWMEKSRKDNFDQVSVEGGTAIIQGEGTALENNATIELPKGTYTLPSMANYEGITIIGDANGGTVIGGENATTGFASNFGKSATIKNVTFSGKSNGVRWSYANGGDTEFENCTFAGESTYGFHIDSSNDANFIFTNCTFSGFNAFAGDLASVTFNNCTFKHNGNYGHTNIWSNGYFNNCTWEGNTSVSPAGSGKLYFNNEEESYHHEYIGSAESLRAFAATVNSTEEPDSWKGQKVILVADIDLNNEAWTPIGAANGGTYFQGIFDGQGYTISNLNVDKSEDTYGNSSAGLFGWIDAAGATIKNVKVDNATVKGSHWTGVIAGYATGRIENCTVTNATVVGYNVNNDANGDKIGGIVGFLNEHSYLNGNTVSASTITGNRDLGGIVGAVANTINEMKDNKVENVNITYSTPKDYASAGIFVSGRTGYEPDNSNTYSNVTIDCEINSDEALAAAIKNGITEIKLADGTYNMPSLSDKTFTFIGASKENTILNMLKTGGNNPQYAAKSITYKNLTVNRPTTIYQGVNAESESFENCILKGLQFLYSNKITYTNCDFDANGAEHCSWTYGADEVSFTGCTFTYADRAVNCYTEQSDQATKATFTDCTFTKVAGKATSGAIETNSSRMKELKLNINNCTVNEGDLWWVPTQHDSKKGEKTIVTIDGKRVVATAEQLTVAVNAGVQEVHLGGSFRMPSSTTTSALTIVGNDTDVIDNTWGAYWDSAELTFENVKFKTGTGYVTSNGTNFGSDYAALYSKNVTYNECTFSGPMRLGRDGATFTKCTFNDLGNDYVWTYGNAATFKGCTFNSDGKALLIYSDNGNGAPAVSVTDCKFYATTGAKAGAISNQNCAAIEIHNLGYGVTLTTDGNTVEIADDKFSGEWRIKKYETLNANSKIFVNEKEYTTIALDGTTMTINGTEVTVN